MKRHLLKRIDLYLLKKFLGLFLMTFIITSFILLMQFLWVHVRDLVGKGVEINVLAEFFIYAVMSVVPLALPLAILLASLMCFGNLGEHRGVVRRGVLLLQLYPAHEPDQALGIDFLAPPEESRTGYTPR